MQVTKLHMSHHKKINIVNLCTPPRLTIDPDHATEDTDITNTSAYNEALGTTILTSDINAYSTIWHSHTDDHRGNLISHLRQNSTVATLNDTLNDNYSTLVIK